MPVFDRQCKSCGKQLIDCLEPSTAPEVICECGQPTERVWLGHFGAVIDDSIPGGIWMKNAICNPDGTPKKYYSHSDIRRAAEKAGVTNVVRHVGTKDGDKSKYTTRWY